MAENSPVPDPTVLTTEQLLREVDRVKELTEAQLHGLEAVTEEKFHSVNRQFSLVEQQRVEQKKDTKDAVDAALTAQKEAVREQTTASGLAIAKSEAATANQLEQLTATFATAIKGVSDIVSDLKDRVVAIESARQGGRETLTGLYALAGVVIAALAIVVSVYLAAN